LLDLRSNRFMTTTTAPSHPEVTLAESSLAHPVWDEVTRQIATRSFALVATTSPIDRPHAAGILYDEVEGALYFSTVRESRKGRNIAANPNVAVTVPIRRIPVGPPANAMFQAAATILDNDDPEVRRLADTGRLKTISGHGELELAEGCVIRIDPPRVIHTYGLGISLWALMREPLRGGGRVERP
jgi:hypothetical protein